MPSTAMTAIFASEIRFMADFGPGSRIMEVRDDGVDIELNGSSGVVCALEVIAWSCLEGWEVNVLWLLNDWMYFYDLYKSYMI